MAAVGFNEISGASAFIATSPGTTVFTVGASKTRTVSVLRITNIDTSNAVVVSIHHIPSGGSFSGNDYMVVPVRSIRAADGNFGAEDFLHGEIFETGDKLVVVAGTGSKLKFSCSGVETDN